MIVQIPDEPNGKTVQPQRPRGVFYYFGRHASDGNWFCIAPALWWGDGVTEAMVQEGCRTGQYYFVCEGSGVGSPECAQYALKKKLKARARAATP